MSASDDEMESSMQHPPPEFLSENLLKLDAIFEEVQKNLPTIDFEVSDVSSEEDMPIFHRNLKTPSDDGADDDLVMWNDGEGGESSELRSNSVPRGMTGACNAMLGEMGLPSLPQQTTSSVGCGTDDFIESSKPTIKRNTWVGQDAADPKQQASMFISPSAPNLSLDRALESLMLGNLDNQEISGYSEACDNNTDCNQNTQDDKESNLSLIQRLAAMTVEQSGTHLQEVDPETGALKSKRILQKEGRALKDTKTALNESVVKQASTVIDSVPRHDRPNLPRSSLQYESDKSSKQERDTVYIDLRGFDKNKQTENQNMETIQRILQITQSQAPSDSSSDSDGDSGEEMWHEQRRRIKQSLQTSGKMPTQRALARPLARNQPKAPTMRTQAQRLAGHLPIKRKAENEERLKGEFVEAQSDPEKLSAHTEAKIRAIEEEERLRKLDIAKKVRDQKENERQSRLRLGQSLEALRPSTSNRGKQAAGVATPTLFDIEACYEPAPETLPPGLPDDLEVVLLTIYLSCNGEMTQHRGGSSRGIDTSLGLSASYSCLLAWLLGLVPEDFRSLLVENPVDDSPAPFHVIGMQQMVHDDQFALYVAVTPTQGAVQAGKTFRKKKAQSAFQQLLARYLSTNTLQSVCPWLQDLVSMEVNGPSGDGQPSFTYRPPLPNITTRPLSTFIQMNPNRQAAQRILSERVGFFWYTMEVEAQQHCLMRGEGPCTEEPQSTMALVYKRVYRSSSSLMGILNRILQEGLDLSGLRLLFPTPDLLGSDADASSNVGPVLALALRGAFARSLWLDAVGPSDPVLARKTDPNCLCALYGGESRDECLVFSPRHPSRIHTEMARWFGGRVPKSGVIDVGSKSKTKGIPSTNCPSITLVCCTKADVFLTVSPLVPVKALGLLLATCQRRGYQLHGVRRLHLNVRQATGIGLSPKESSAFVANTLDDIALTDGVLSGSLPQRPCVVLLLQKENAAHGVASLIEALMVQLAFKNMLSVIQGFLSEPLVSNLLFKSTVFSESLLIQLGGDFSKVPDRELSTAPSYISPQIHCNPELEQVVVLTLTGHQRMVNFGLFLGRLLGVVPHSQQQVLSTLVDGLELLAVKWLPSLSVLHAKELTPYEVGHKQWKSSVHTLTSEPAVVLVMRGINAFKRLEVFINPPNKHSAAKTSVPLDRILSPTGQVAFCQARLFFQDHELMSDDDARLLKDFLPPNTRLSLHQNKSKKTSKGRGSGESVFQLMQAGPRPICTLLVVKPHALAKGLAKLMKKVTHEGFTVVGLKQTMITNEQAVHLVPLEDAQNDVLRTLHVDYITSAPCLLLCLLRENAVRHLLNLLGPEEPRAARSQSSFAWRGVFGNDAVANAFYASANYTSAVNDIKQFFPEGICCETNVDLMAENIPFKVDDTILDSNSAKSRKIEHRDMISSPDGHAHTKHTGSGGPTLQPLPPVSSLTQTNCIILMPSLMTSPSGRGSSRRSAPFVEILEAILSSSPGACGLVGARLLWLNAVQSQHCLHCINAGSFALVPLLTRGPALVLALQGDDAILSFNTTLGSNFDKNSILSKYGDHILRPHHSAQANQLLTFCFDRLIPEAQLNISLC